jgi:hypothetical protein
MSLRNAGGIGVGSSRNSDQRVFSAVAGFFAGFLQSRVISCKFLLRSALLLLGQLSHFGTIALVFAWVLGPLGALVTAVGFQTQRVNLN